MPLFRTVPLPLRAQRVSSSSSTPSSIHMNHLHTIYRNKCLTKNTCNERSVPFQWILSFLPLFFFFFVPNLIIHWLHSEKSRNIYHVSLPGLLILWTTQRANVSYNSTLQDYCTRHPHNFNNPTNPAKKKKNANPNRSTIWFISHHSHTWLLHIFDPDPHEPLPRYTFRSFTLSTVTHFCPGQDFPVLVNNSAFNDASFFFFMLSVSCGDHALQICTTSWPDHVGPSGDCRKSESCMVFGGILPPNCQLFFLSNRSDWLSK